MALSKKPYKGTRDFYPEIMRKREYLFDVMKKTAGNFAYEPYDGPLVEEVNLYRAKSGEELINEQIYSFYDRGEREIAIRPEMTPTLARMVAQIHKESSKPLRWYSLPNLMRYERPQKGRLREHWQFNVDIFGAPEIYAEMEILQFLVSLMKNFGATHKNFEILVNDRRFVDEIFKNHSSETSHKLYKILDKSKKISPEALEETLEKVNLSEPEKKQFKKYLELKNFDDALELTQDKDIKKRFEKFIKLIKELSLEKYIVFDPAIVRGLDYYTGIVFEVFDKNPENRRAICGGGAYADLLKIFNESKLPGVGFGMGDVTLGDFLETHGLMPNNHEENDLYMSFQIEGAEASLFKMAQDLRDQGLSVVTGLEKQKINKVFKNAEIKGAKVVAFLGEQESQTKTLQLKNMQTKETQNFKQSQIKKIKEWIRGEMHER